MIALADYALQDDVPCTIVAVIADTDAPGLIAAAQRGLPTFKLPAEDYTSKAEHEAAIIDIINNTGAENIFLAGYMRLLSANFCMAFEHRLFNIHPSLLPRHKGLDTHERALAAGDKSHGCSVHLVSPEMDDGLILAQRAVEVRDDDTPDTLAARVLDEEHKLYPALLGALAAQLLTFDDGQPNMHIGTLPGRINGAKTSWPI